MIPGALTSARDLAHESREAPPSMGWPMPSTTRPRSSGPTGTSDNGSAVTLKDVTVITEDHDSDVALLKVEGYAAEAAGKDNHLSGLDLLEAVDTGNSISRDDLSHLSVLGGGVESLSGGTRKTGKGRGSGGSGRWRGWRRRGGRSRGGWNGWSTKGLGGRARGTGRGERGGLIYVISSGIISRGGPID